VQQSVREPSAPLTPMMPSSDEWKTSTWINPALAGTGRARRRASCTSDLPSPTRAGASAVVHMPTRRYWTTFGSIGWLLYSYTLALTAAAHTTSCSGATRAIFRRRHRRVQK
jgi:hypothetical protein